MTNYIVKNCPACHPYDVFGRDNEGCCYLEMKYCKEVTNCLMKQIAEKCLDAIKTYDNNQFYEDDLDFFMGKHCGAEEILDLLEIQEGE